MKPILEVQNLSKKFNISHIHEPYLSFRDTVMNLFKPKMQTEKIWALRDINFEVQEGDSVGIIGKNGSGKSTLLKILSNITSPTDGKVITRGRTASLLEVGTGFHPELTGRENIYFNGVIMGMKRKEITAKFDEIVDFSKIEKFLDTPLKRYSSGMQLRLAFSVAAFLEPEILIIDEVLAVGDAEFQKKCIGKMESVTRGGRTILFVSHNMAAVERVCQKAILLSEGELKTYSSSSETIQAYSSSNHHLNALTSPGEYTFDISKSGCISKIEFLCDGKLSNLFYTNCEFEIRVHFKSENYLDHPLLGITIYDNQHISLLHFSNKHYAENLFSHHIKAGIISIKFPSLPLLAGTYSIDIHFNTLFSALDLKNDVAQLKVEENRVTEISGKLDTRRNKFFIKDLIWTAEIEK